MLSVATCDDKAMDTLGTVWKSNWEVFLSLLLQVIVRCSGALVFENVAVMGDSAREGGDVASPAPRWFGVLDGPERVLVSDLVDSGV